MDEINDNRIDEEAKTCNTEQKDQSDKNNSSENEHDDLQKEIDDYKNQIEEWKDKYTRLFAEFDNYKKRTRQERFDLINSAGADIISDLLLVVDDFERALSSLEVSDDIDSVKEGYNLIYNKLINTLKRRGLEPLDSLGNDFDTDLHEAVSMVASEDKKGKVVEVVQKGYKLKDKVLRYAKVVVGN
ncbi:MAG: nucleotide exchange factor GrpE [Bacteroidales bacterium]|nr:nucleotide exchange factor GrpE [Bacteroidales bacterium]